MPLSCLQRAATLVFCIACAARAEPPITFRWPTPHVMEDVEIPGIVVARGIPMKLHAIRVRHTMDEMIDLYTDAFRRAGFYIPPPKDQVQVYALPSLTALDPVHDRSYTVMFQANPDHSTTLVLGEANLALRAVPPRSSELPIFPGAEGVIRTESEGSHTLTYQVRAPPKDVLAFYRDTLSKGGYQFERQEGDGAVFTSNGEELSATARASSGSTQVILVSHLRALGG